MIERDFCRPGDSMTSSTSFSDFSTAILVSMFADLQSLEDIHHFMDEAQERSFTDKERRAVVRTSMEYCSFEKATILLNAWGRDIVFDLVDMAMFWQNRAAVEAALPYIVQLPAVEVKKLALDAAVEGFTNVLNLITPFLDTEEQVMLMIEGSHFDDVREAIYAICDKPQMIKRLMDHQRADLAQWVEDRYRPEYEQSLLTEAVGPIERSAAGRKI